MPRKLRCAVIGTGGIGMKHLRHLAACPQAAVTAIAETNPKCVDDALKAVPIPRVFQDYRHLLEDRAIDAVVIALPNYLHASVAIEAMEAGKHVLVEKPMATSARDAERMVTTSRRTGRILMVGQNFRFNRHTQLAKKAIERGRIGDPYHTKAFWLRRCGIPRIGSWFTQQKLAGGGCTYDLGVHLLDTSLYLLDEFDAVAVSGKTHSKVGPQGRGSFEWGKSEIDPTAGFDVDDFSLALVRLRSGRCIQLEISWAAFLPPGDREHGIDILGDRGGISLFPAKLFTGDLKELRVEELDAKRLKFPESTAVHFVSAVLKEEPVLISPEQSLHVQRVLDGIYESCRLGREVAIAG